LDSCGRRTRCHRYAAKYLRLLLGVLPGTPRIDLQGLVLVDAELHRTCTPMTHTLLIGEHPA